MKRPRVLPLNLSGIGFLSTSKMAAQSYSQGNNHQKGLKLFRYSDWLSRYSHVKTREKCVRYQNFPTHFGLSLSLECSDKISRQSVKSTYPINSLKEEVFLQKSNARF